MKKTFLSIALFAAFAAQAAVIGPDNLATANQGQNQGQAQGQGQGQAQGQLQGQGQAQGQGQVANGGDARAQGGNAAAGAAAGAISGAAAGAISGSTSGATSGSTSGASTGAVDASSKNANGAIAAINIEATQPLRRTEVVAAPQVYAPPALTTAVCVIGVSAGGSGMGWGFALGSGIKDEGCELRALAQVMHAQGDATAAKELLCSDERVAAAYKRAGRACKADAAAPKATSMTSPPTTVLVPEVVLRPAEG